MKKNLIAAFVFVLLAGCATRYQKQDMFGNGFSEMKTSLDSFIVNFKGNSYSRSDKMMQYALRRASELTLENGYRYFKIVQTIDTSDITGSSGSISKAPAFSIRVKCFKEKTNDVDVVDADFFLQNNL